MNTVILIGNLTTDVELREFGPEKHLATFGLAVDRGGKDSETDFFRISVWDRQAQLCADYLAKGRQGGQEAGGEREAARLAKTRSDRHQERRAESELAHETRRALRAAPAEPADQFLSTVTEHRAADDEADE